MSYRFYRDANGEPKAKTAPAERLLGRFLEAEMQGSSRRCAMVLAALDDIATGRKKRWQQSGNAHTLVLSKRRARIQVEFGSEPDLILSPLRLRQALLDWRALLHKAQEPVR